MNTESRRFAVILALNNIYNTHNIPQLVSNQLASAIQTIECPYTVGLIYDKFNQKVSKEDIIAVFLYVINPVAHPLPSQFTKDSPIVNAVKERNTRDIAVTTETRVKSQLAKYGLTEEDMTRLTTLWYEKGMIEYLQQIRDQTQQKETQQKEKQQKEEEQQQQLEELIQKTDQIRKETEDWLAKTPDTRTWITRGIIVVVICIILYFIMSYFRKRK